MSKNSPSRVLARRFGWRITSALFATVLFWGISSEATHASAIRATDQIDFNGNNIIVDSYDSADPAHSINGLYTPGRALAGAVITTTSTIINSISLGNALIKGRIATGPGGTIAIGVNGSVGDNAWVSGGNMGIQPGHFSDDVNATYPPVQMPGDFSAGGLVYNNLTVNGVTYAKAILTSGDYLLTSLTGSLYIGSNLTCRIKVTTNLNLTGSSQLRVASGTRVKMYVSGTNVSFGGNGVVNENPNAESFMYFGLPANTSVMVGKSFVGTIYAPQADFRFGSGGSQIQDFIGCVMAKSVEVVGHASFHFDENLYRVGPFTPTFTNQPQNQTVAPGESVTFTAAAFGPPAFGYQWYFFTNVPPFGWQPIAGATNETLTVANAGARQAGYYHLVATNSYGGTPSASVMLTVTTPPIVVPIRTNLATTVGRNVSISCLPEGNFPFYLRWFFNETNEVSSANGSILNLTNVQLTDAGLYTLVVTNPYGATTSAPIALTVYETAAASLSGFVPTSESGSQFSISGVPGYKYAIESSTNLADWERVVTNTAPFNFTDTNAVVLPQRFYRAIYLP